LLTDEQLAPPARVRLALGAIVALGVAARIYGVVAFPYEQDEIYTRIESTELFATRLKPGIEARPLYYLLQHAVSWVLPTSPVTMRLLPLLFGLAGIWATWVLARRWLGTTAAVIATALVALSPWHLYASAMARYWSLVYLLAALAFFLVPAAYDRDEPRGYLAALAALVLGTLTHPTFVFPVAGAVLGLSLISAAGGFGWRWPSRKGWAYLWGPYVGFLVAAWVALRLAGREGALQNWQGRGLDATLRLVPGIVEWTSPVVFGAAIAGALMMLRGTTVAHHRRWGAMAVGGIGVGLLVLLATSLRTDVYVDYGMALLPLLVVSCGGLVQLWAARPDGSGTRWSVAASGGFVLAAGLLPSVVSYLSDGMRFDYRPAYARIQAEAPGAVVLTWPEVLGREYAPRLRLRPIDRRQTHLDSLLRREGGAWAVVSRGRGGVVGAHRAGFEEWLRERCRVVSADERPRLDYRMYRVELWWCGTAAAQRAAVDSGGDARAGLPAPR
jgi:hypothetical protein